MPQFVSMIALEEWRTEDGRMLKSGALRLEGPAPIRRNDKIVGSINSIQRYGDAVVARGEIEVFTPGEYLEMDVDGILVVDVEEGFDFTVARLRAAVAGRTPAFPQSIIVPLGP